MNKGASVIRVLTKCRLETMSGTSGQGSLPLHKLASGSKVLSALDAARFPAMDFRPDEDGIIDLTTPENDIFYGVVNAQVGRPSSSTDSVSSSSRRVENRRLKKTDSLKENEGPMNQSSNRGHNAMAPYPASINPQRPGIVIKPPPQLPGPTYPPYHYADNIPVPKVIYIRDEKVANEMVASLNG